MVLTDREIVINIAKNVDFETLALVDTNKLNEFADDAIVKGKASAAGWSTSVTWTDQAALTHPLYELYKEVYQIYAAIHLLMRISDYSEEVKGFMEIAERKGMLLNKGIKEMATYGVDQGVSKIRSTSGVSADLTYPKNLGAEIYHSVSFLKGRRGRR